MRLAQMTPGEQTGKRSNYSLSAWKWCKGRKKQQQHALVFCTKNVTFKKQYTSALSPHSLSPECFSPSYWPYTGSNLESFISFFFFFPDPAGLEMDPYRCAWSPTCLGQKGVYKLGDSVARRFTQGFESPAALGDAQLPTRPERRNTNFCNLSESLFSHPSLMFGLFFTQTEKAKHLNNRHLYIFSHYVVKCRFCEKRWKLQLAVFSAVSLDGKFWGPQWWGCVLQTNKNLLIFHLQNSTCWTHCSCYDNLAEWQYTKLFSSLFLKSLNKSTPLLCQP